MFLASPTLKLMGIILYIPVPSSTLGNILYLLQKSLKNPTLGKIGCSGLVARCLKPSSRTFENFLNHRNTFKKFIQKIQEKSNITMHQRS